jgi:hypothetical protein
MNERMTVAWHLKMTPTEKRMFDQLSERTGIAKSVLVRDLIRAHFTMTLTLSPTCANGRQCMCPQLNVVQPLPNIRELADRADQPPPSEETP